MLLQGQELNFRSSSFKSGGTSWSTFVMINVDGSFAKPRCVGTLSSPKWCFFLVVLWLVGWLVVGFISEV